jgi:hypothetical protein
LSSTAPRPRPPRRRRTVVDLDISVLRLMERE